MSVTKTQFKQMVSRLRKPSVALSLVSHVLTLCITMGFELNENHIMSVATILCSILVTLGILSNPESLKKGYGDDYLICSASGKLEQHVKVNNQMVCANCGAVYNPEAKAVTKSLENPEPAISKAEPVMPGGEIPADITDNTEQAG